MIQSPEPSEYSWELFFEDGFSIPPATTGAVA